MVRNLSKSQTIKISSKKEEIDTFSFRCIGIVGDKIQLFENILSNETINIKITPRLTYMIINLSTSEVEISFSENPVNHELLYNPYAFENEKHTKINPNEFKTQFKIPNGYIETLTKWYSIKYTYPNESYIFIRPKCGISLQTHNDRDEFWEIGFGKPIIIIDNKVYYDTKMGEKFTVLKNTLHSIINPTNEWILIKEKFQGKFDEEDIIRIFNPNKFGLKFYGGL